jgi:hypothetical protein
MSSSKRWAVGGLLLAVAVCSVSCATHTPLAGRPWERDELAVGTKIRVTTTEGEQTTFTLTTIEEDALVGRGRRIAFSEIADVELVDPTTWKNTLLYLGGSIGLMTIMIWAAGGVKS